MRPGGGVGRLEENVERRERTAKREGAGRSTEAKHEDRPSASASPTAAGALSISGCGQGQRGRRALSDDGTQYHPHDLRGLLFL